MSHSRHSVVIRTRAARSLAAAAILLVGAGSASGIVTFGTNGLDGSNVNTLIGANRFYMNGIHGANTIVSNIEAGNVWNGHTTLTFVTQYNNGTGALGDFDRHATWVGAAIAGRHVGGGEFQRGIADAATLWSGAIATAWNGPTPYRTNFSSTITSELSAYKAAAITGAGGNTADIINSSWGTSGPGNNGFTTRAVALGVLAYQTTKLVIFSAGNDGPNTNTVGDPGLNPNLFTVGALHFDGAAFSTIANFSSRGPQPYFDPFGPQVPAVHAAVDICAPGDTLTLAFYGGLTGGNLGAVNDPSTTTYSTGLGGTSFAAPIVAGSASLVLSAARANGYSVKASDARVIKAILMNSADKPAGWTNNATTPGGVHTTSQGLDFTYGAGAVNLDQAYSQLTTGTKDVPGTGGGVINTIGWDFGNVASGTPNNYTIPGLMQAGTRCSALLTWFQHDLYDFNNIGVGNASISSLFDLKLEVFQGVPSGPSTLVAISDAKFNNLNELIYFNLPTTGLYFFRITFVGAIYNFDGDALNADYGFAWAVPTPACASVLLVGALGIRRRRR